ncbi:MAG: hypothetical protein B6U85_07650 [Desulfurococcales archaeon ex4484_42]|nr:MAG: hypothetical protein B6U85_07650 [Desulfurococcales archaeon ex4484_42]
MRLSYLKTSALITLLLLTLYSPITHVARAEDIKVQEIDFCYYGIYGYIKYPEETHPGSFITISVLVVAGVDLYLNYFNMTVYAFIGEGWSRLYKATLISNLSMDEGDYVLKDISIYVPKQASGRLLLVVASLTTVYGITAHGFTLLNITYVRELTYDEALQRYEELYSNYTDLLNYTSALKQNLTALEGKYSKLLKDYENLEAMYETLSSNYETLENNYLNLKSRYQELQKTLTSLNGKLQELSKERDELEKKLSNLTLNYTTLLSDYRELNETYTSLLKDYKALRSDYLKLTKEFNDLKRKHTALTSDYEHLKSSYEELSRKYENSLGEVSRLRNYFNLLIVLTSICGVIIAILVVMLVKLRK